MNRRKAIGVWMTLIGIATLFIWGQSLLSAFLSAKESGYIVALIADCLGVSPDAEWLHVLVRKVAHFTEFGVLGVLWGGYGRLRPQRWGWLYGLAVASVDETLQFFSPGRAPQISDVLLDYAGYLCGLLLVWCVLRLAKMRRPEK